MTISLKKNVIALAAITAMALPLQSAIAQTGDPITIVRNDYSNSATKMPLTLPKNFKPVAGICYLWVPKNSANTMPAPISCETVIPFGAVKISS